MKIHRAVLFFCLAGVCFLADYPVYGSPLKSDNEQMELCLEKLQVNIAEEEKAIESLKKRYEDILREKQNSEAQTEDALARKELDKLQKEKISLENQLKALKEERKNRPARDTAQLEPRPDEKIRSARPAGRPARLAAKPRAGKAGNGARKEEIKENSFPGESIDSKNSKKQRPPCFEVSRENKPGILKGFLDKARKIDSLWREKVW